MKKRTILIALIMFILSTSVIFAGNHLVSGDVFSFFKTVNINQNTQVNGSVVSIFGDVMIYGEVNEDVVTIFGRVYIDGTVNHDVVSILGGITISQNAEIRGSAVAVLGHGIYNYGGRIGRDEIDILGFAPRGISPIASFFAIVAFLIIAKQISAFMIAIAVLAIFPERFNQMIDGNTVNSGRKAIIGFLVYLGSFVVVVMIAMTIIGAPLLIILIPVMLILFYCGNIVAKITIGRKIGRISGRNFNVIVELLIGTLIFILLEVSIIGNLLIAILKFVAIGEIVDSKFGSIDSGGKKLI